jgi:hypothetical protein
MAENDDEHIEHQVRRLVEANDPMRGKQIAEPRRTAAQLRQLVDQRQVVARRRVLGRPAMRLHRLAPVAAVALAAGGLLLVNVLPPGAPGSPAPVPVAMGAAPAALHMQFPDQASPARPWLQQLAERTARLDEPVDAGRYTYLRTQSWSVESTAADPHDANAVVARDERLWWAADRSGREEISTLPPQPGDASRADWLDGPPPGSAGARAHYNYRPGELAVVIDEPSTDPALLAGQLSAHEPFSNGPQAVIRAVASMYRYHEMSPALRAAVLHVLAETDGLMNRGRVVDRAGRVGVAVSVDTDAGATRDLAVLDPATGTLLSYEQVALISPPRSAVRAPAVISYVLYLAHQRTDQLG